MKLSIVTINYNNREGLQRTMESVFAQTYKDFEYIVIDGASTDGSAEYIREHADKLTYWVSEKDTGIYNAMNKGVRVAKGEYLLMLNSGDFFWNESVVEKIIPELHGEDIIQGNIVIEKNGKMYKHAGYARSNINFIDVYIGYFLHQSVLSKRALFDEYGYFDESYRVISDYIFFLKTLGYGKASLRYVDINIAFFMEGGVSSKTNLYWWNIHQEEEKRMYSEMYSPRLLALCEEAPKKIEVYDSLHRNSIIWLFTRLLLFVARKINKTENIKIEQIR